MSAYLDGVHKDLPTGTEAPVRGGGARAEDAGAQRPEDDGRGSLQRDAQAHRDRQEDPRAQQDRWRSSRR